MTMKQEERCESCDRHVPVERLHAVLIRGREYHVCLRCLQPIERFGLHDDAREPSRAEVTP